MSPLTVFCSDIGVDQDASITEDALLKLSILKQLEGLSEWWTSFKQEKTVCQKTSLETLKCRYPGSYRPVEMENIKIMVQDAVHRLHLRNSQIRARGTSDLMQESDSSRLLELSRVTWEEATSDTKDVANDNGHVRSPVFLPDFPLFTTHTECQRCSRERHCQRITP